MGSCWITTCYALCIKTFRHCWLNSKTRSLNNSVNPCRSMPSQSSSNDYALTRLGLTPSSRTRDYGAQASSQVFISPLYFFITDRTGKLNQRPVRAPGLQKAKSQLPFLVAPDKFSYLEHNIDTIRFKNTIFTYNCYVPRQCLCY